MSVLSDKEWIAENALAFAIWDGFPVSPGHALVLPRREVSGWFELTVDERAAVWELVDEVRGLVAAKAVAERGQAPDGWNLGINVGAAAGQTVWHVHVHVIPRFDGDMDDPRGGVRHVIPERGNYKRDDAPWRAPAKNQLQSVRAAPLTTGEPEARLDDYLGVLFATSDQITVVSAFTQTSGLDLLQPRFETALVRGANIRLVTGDYLHITQADALLRLLDLQQQTQAFTENDEGGEGPSYAGRLEVRVVEAQKARRSFHPKAWLFLRDTPPVSGVAYVGSSNISKSALLLGVEWNLRLERRIDPNAFNEVVRAADAVWDSARPLDEAWVAEYRKRAKRMALPLPQGESEDETCPAPEPRDVQAEALAALAASRGEGRERAIVVLATGLGKTFLAAFDVRQFAEEQGHPVRTLLLAHRKELLSQAAQTFRRVFPDLKITWCVGAANDLTGDLVLASVQKLSRDKQLESLPSHHFDYVVVDEVHHAAATSYRRLLQHLRPRFLLGLTATPERADDADVLGLFDDHMPYRADLGEGISRELLVPFAYEGLRDTADYSATSIPWRNGRFDPAALARAVQTEHRMATLWAAWQRLPGTRNLVFCASIAHAMFVRDWLRAKGLRVEAVHSAPDSFDREAALRLLEDGKLDAICTVDLFNEGIDCKPIDRVVMLRPTESSVVFLQQLGRGLRIAADKERLQVIDFVGNHRVFLNKVRTLLSLGGEVTPLHRYLRGEDEAVLPPGCAIELELEAKALLSKLLPRGSRSEVVRVYQELRTTRGQRPRAGELFRMGLNLKSLRSSHDGWFGFVRDEGDLSSTAQESIELSGSWLRDLERTSMSKCFKMVVLAVLLEAEALRDGMPLDELAVRCHDYLRRSPELFADLDGARDLEDIASPDRQRWESYWRKNPVRAWTTPNKKQGHRPWFLVDEGRLRFRIDGDKLDVWDELRRMTGELVDLRLAEYRRRRLTPRNAASAGAASSFQLKVLRNTSGNPILHFGNVKARDMLPHGETDVRLDDGSVWLFRFVKIACNVARPVGTQRNALPDLLFRWFGPSAGKPGTTFEVTFRSTPDGWWAAPAESNVVALWPRNAVQAFPTLRAAAGTLLEDGTLQASEIPAVAVRLPVRRSESDSLAVRATGNSMDGGARPIRDGDWVVLRWARSRGLGALDGRVALVAFDDSAGDQQYLLKRVVKTHKGVVLRSDNKAYPDVKATTNSQVLALLDEVVQPESLAPAMGTIGDAEHFQKAFDASEPLPRQAGRVDGHLYLRVSLGDPLRAPDRLAWPLGDRRPGETAFVLFKTASDQLCYGGVARWDETDALWHIPEVDFAMWRRFGSGRGASRRMDEERLNEARQWCRAFVQKRQGAWVEARGRRCRVVGLSAQGGVRVDGGSGGFKERTVSVLDIAWVLEARRTIKGSGAVDEAGVNALRYLNGTPKGSTRWIDTGWALVLTECEPAM